MEEVSTQEKKGLQEKLFEFQIKGLRSYGKYLEDQLTFASKSDSRNAYRKYVEEQIEQNNVRIQRIEAQL